MCVCIFLFVLVIFGCPLQAPPHTHTKHHSFYCRTKSHQFTGCSKDAEDYYQFVCEELFDEATLKIQRQSDLSDGGQVQLSASPPSCYSSTGVFYTSLERVKSSIFSPAFGDEDVYSGFDISVWLQVQQSSSDRKLFSSAWWFH